MADIGTIEITGLEERIKQLDNASTKNPLMEKRIQEVIRKSLQNARKALSNQAQSGLGIQSDPRKAYQAIRMSVYRRIFGGQVNILNSRRAGKGRYYEPKRHPSRIGGNRLRQSETTRRMMTYQGKDRGFILRFLNEGTDVRESRYGKRGSILGRHWFGNASRKELEQAAEYIDKAIDDIVAGILY